MRLTRGDVTVDEHGPSTYMARYVGTQLDFASYGRTPDEAIVHLADELGRYLDDRLEQPLIRY